ncbi:hypothetical protein, partial [Segatella salivae]|uniref:hypothetical protein n=1 Tax=Segatella salivae TaxID=228604 RepID=UPI00241CF50B
SIEATNWLHRRKRVIKIVVIQSVTETSSSFVRTANLIALAMRFFMLIGNRQLEINAFVK